MANTPNSKFVTRKHLARLEKERIQQRYLLIGSGAIIVIVVGLILFGILDQTVLQGNRPVARVGSEVITTKEFQSQVRYTRYRLIEQLSYFASEPMMIQFFGSYIQQIQSQLDGTKALGQQVLDRMIEDEVIAHEAAKMGITVSDEELDKAVEQFFGYFPNGTLTPSVTPTTYSTATLSATQIALVPATATPTEVVLPTETAAPTESATATTGPTATPTAEMTATPDYTATPQPTPTEYTLEGYQGVYNNYLKTLDGIDFSRDELRQLIKAQILRDKVVAEVTKDLPTEAEQVWARHILVATEAEAQAVETRLAAGEDFAALAKELSTDTSNKDNGGDLQWFTREKMATEFSDAAFALKIGEISQPVQTSFGYHVIQVLGHEVRPLTAEETKQAKDTAFSKWIETKQSELKVEKFDRWVDVIPTVPQIPADLLQAISTAGGSGTGTSPLP